MKQQNRFTFSNFFIGYSVPLMFIALSIFTIPLSGFSPQYLVQEMVIRLSRNSFLVLALLIPIIAGMGLNFGMVLGAMAGQIGLIFVTDWNVVGIPGIVLAMILSIPISVFLGWIAGAVLNRAKGREMVTSYILGFFINGLYQFIVMYLMGKVIPIRSNALVLSRGYGIRNAINLEGMRQVLDDLITIKLWNVTIPIATFLLIAVFCLFIIWFRKTKLGQDMRAVGLDMGVAEASGIPVNRTRVISMIISTVLAGFGQIIFLQNIGTLNTYNSHDQTGMYSIAALLIGGATVSKATIPNIFLGVVLFHLMFVTSPMAGKNLIGSAMLGEYFRLFISYGIIAISLVLYAWRRYKEKERSRMNLRGNT